MKKNALQLIQELRECFKNQYGVDVKIDIRDYEAQGNIDEISKAIHSDLGGTHVYWPDSNMATIYDTNRGYDVVVKSNEEVQ